MTPSPYISNYLPHILALRTRVLRALACWASITLLCLPFASRLFEQLAKPLLQKLLAHAVHPASTTSLASTTLPAATKLAPVLASPQLIATAVTSPIIIPLKTALFFGMLFSAPFILQQLWQFFSPALYVQERKMLRSFLLTSVLLFYLGLTFAYLIALPLMFQFFIGHTPSFVHMMPDMSQYFGFVMQMMLAFALVFQLPVLMLFATYTSWLTVSQMAQGRRYAIVGAFVVGMLLTPPDVVSQLMLALPLCLLFEVGLGLAMLFKKRD